MAENISLVQLLNEASVAIRESFHAWCVCLLKLSSYPEVVWCMNDPIPPMPHPPPLSSCTLHEILACSRERCMHFWGNINHTV